MKWREMKGNVELLGMCMCIVFAFQLIRAKEVRIDIEVKRSEEKWREVMTCDVSPVAMFFLKALPISYGVVISISSSLVKLEVTGNCTKDTKPTTNSLFMIALKLGWWGFWALPYEGKHCLFLSFIC